MECPDRWLLLRIVTEDSILTRILGGWWGGYLDSDYWRLSSNIVSVQKVDNHYIAKTESGNMYSIGKGNYGTTGFSASVLDGIKEKANAEGTGMRCDEFEENIALSFIESLTLTSEPFYNPQPWGHVESEESTDHDD